MRWHAAVGFLGIFVLALAKFCSVDDLSYGEVSHLGLDVLHLDKLWNVFCFKWTDLLLGKPVVSLEV